MNAQLAKKSLKIIVSVILGLLILFIVYVKVESIRLEKAAEITKPFICLGKKINYNEYGEEYSVVYYGLGFEFEYTHLNEYYDFDGNIRYNGERKDFSVFNRWVWCQPYYPEKVFYNPLKEIIFGESDD